MELKTSMSKLTHLKQRIQTVGTIKKTTHAMRLTSMSTHTRLKKQKKSLSTYKDVTQEILQSLSRVELPHTSRPQQNLYIVVGAQKGLCGSFNNRLASWAEKELLALPFQPEIVCVGKKAQSYLAESSLQANTAYPTFTGNNYSEIAHAIIRKATQATAYFSHLVIYSTYSESFFSQKTRKTVLPLPTLLSPTESASYKDNITHKEIIYEQSPQKIKLYAEQLYAQACLEETLFLSLVAEHAARFVSMDSATRNADNLITAMKRDYNKLRQGAITRELIDLTSGQL